MSRWPQAIKLVDLEEGRPTVEQARLRMQYELEAARRAGYKAVKLVHGYGSSGAGGTLRTELQKDLRKAVRQEELRAFLPGENWRLSDETAWEVLQRFPEWKQDPDLGRNNQGISIVIL